MVSNTFISKLAAFLRDIDNRMVGDALERRALLHYTQGDRVPEILRMLRESSLYKNAII